MRVSRRWGSSSNACSRSALSAACRTRYWSIPSSISRGNCGHGSYELALVDAEHDLAEDRQGRAAPGLLVPERAVVVKSDPDRDRDSLRPAGGSHEQRIAEVAGRSGFAHHGDREVAAIEGVGGPRRETDHPAQPLLDQDEVIRVDRDRGPGRLVERRAGGVGHGAEET